MKNEMKLTVQQLRRLLFEVTNQEMTVRELRQCLFDVDDQDMPVTEENIDTLIEVKR